LKIYDKMAFVYELVKSALLTIYTEEGIEFDEEVKAQIYEIVEILPEESNFTLKKQELAKL